MPSKKPNKAAKKPGKAIPKKAAAKWPLPRRQLEPARRPASPYARNTEAHSPNSHGKPQARQARGGEARRQGRAPRHAAPAEAEPKPARRKRAAEKLGRSNSMPGRWSMPTRAAADRRRRRRRTGRSGQPAGGPAQRKAVHRPPRRAVHEQGAAGALRAHTAELEARSDGRGRPHRAAHEGRGGQFSRSERPRHAGRGIQPRAAHARSRAQADPQDRRGAEAHRGRLLRLLPGDRRGNRHQAPRGAAGRHAVASKRRSGANAAKSSTATATTDTAESAPAAARATRARALRRAIRALADRRFAPGLPAERRGGSYLDARANGGRWLVRIEDLDRPRVVPGCAAQILATLEAFGFEWDGAIVRQSAPLAHYAAALEALRAARADLLLQLLAARARRGGRATRAPAARARTAAGPDGHALARRTGNSRSPIACRGSAASTSTRSATSSCAGAMAPSPTCWRWWSTMPRRA